jgi:hypothetical protein
MIWVLLEPIPDPEPVPDPEQVPDLEQVPDPEPNLGPLFSAIDLRSLLKYYEFETLIKKNYQPNLSLFACPIELSYNLYIPYVILRKKNINLFLLKPVQINVKHLNISIKKRK